MTNLTKSIFISLLNVFAIYIFISSAYSLFYNEFSYLDISKIISAGTIIIYFAGLFLKPTARTSLHLKKYTIVIIISLFIGLLGSYLEKYSISYTYINAILLLGWIVYVKWYSKLEVKRTNLLKINNELPFFELEDTNRQKVRSNQFKGFFSILLFYRGNWCPLCMAQIKEIASLYRVLENKKVKTILISPQPHENSALLAKKYNLNFQFLVDTNAQTAKNLGIYHQNGLPAGLQILGYSSNTVFPTVIITDTDNKIIFLDQTDNYRIRPEPQTFLDIIDAYS